MFGGPDVYKATYNIGDVDRLPSTFPIADCREGYNITFEADIDLNEVLLKNLDVDEPKDIRKTKADQLWCVNTCNNECKCTNTNTGRLSRGHIEDAGDAGTIVYRIESGLCFYIHAEEPTVDNNSTPPTQTPGNVTLTTDASKATTFQFVVAPNTEISQIRFSTKNTNDKKFVLTWDSVQNFENANGDGNSKLVSSVGYLTNPLVSCFKAYRFLSNARIFPTKDIIGGATTAASG